MEHVLAMSCRYGPLRRPRREEPRNTTKQIHGTALTFRIDLELTLGALDLLATLRRIIASQASCRHRFHRAVGSVEGKRERERACEDDQDRGKGMALKPSCIPGRPRPR